MEREYTNEELIDFMYDVMDWRDSEDLPMIYGVIEELKKMKAYRDAEEQGLLLRLPCKVGDTVYLVDFEEMAYDEATVWSIEIDTKDNRILINSDYEVGTWAEDGYVFYSREEAEKALADMQKG